MSATKKTAKGGNTTPKVSGNMKPQVQQNGVKPKLTKAQKKANKAFANPSMPPRFPSGAAGRSRQRQVVTEDEYIGEINGSVSFATTQYSVNPGQSGTFPWLYKEAALFEKYQFLNLEFYYKPEVSAYATNGQSGKVMLSFDFDASDPPPGSKTQVEDTHPHADAMPYEECILRIDKSELSRSDAIYVRPGGLPGGADIKTYDVGTLSVSTYGNTNTSVIGELRVRYTVALEIPVLENTVSAPTNYRVSWYQSTSGEAAGATGVTKTLALATATVNGLSTSNSSGVITLPVGNYVVNGDLLTQNTGNNETSGTMYLLVNGSASPLLEPAFSISAIGYIPMHATWFVSSTGSTTVALAANIAYSSGTETLVGSLLIQTV